jgi:hypothetical protein
MFRKCRSLAALGMTVEFGSGGLSEPLELFAINDWAEKDHPALVELQREMCLELTVSDGLRIPFGHPPMGRKLPAAACR